MKDRFKDKSPIAEAIAGPSIEDEILAALENQPQVQTTAPPMFAEPEPTGITEEGRLAEAVDVGRFEDQILQAAATEEPSTASRFVDGVIEAAKGIQPLEVLESTPRVLGGIVSGVGEGVARAPTDLAALAAAGLQKAEQLALEGLDVSEESRLKAEAEWDETVGFFLDISESISEGVGATREDISQADIPIASELFREKTETEQAFTELGTLFGGVTIGTRQALKSTNALGAKLSPRQQITTVARGGLTGEILVSNPDMDTASLSRQFGGAEFEGRLARVFESRIVEPGEGLAIAGTITGTIAGGKQIAKGVKFSKQKLDVVLAEGINKLPDKVLEKVPYDVRVGLAKPVTREEYITLSKSTDADVVNKVKSRVEDDLSPEALEAALKGHSSPKDDLLMLAAETNTSPSLLSEFLPDYKSYALNSKQLDKIIGNIGDPITSLRRGWKAFFNGYGYLQDMTRLKASQNLDLDIGHKDILERARMSKIAVIDSQTGSQAESLIGDPDKVAKMVKEGKSYVLTRAKPGQVKEIDGHTADVSDLLIRQENTKPLTQVHQEAWAKGATPAEVNDYEKALDGMDTIFNQELRSTQLQKEIKELAKGQDVGTILKEEPNSLIAQEIRNRQQAIKDYYTVDEANKKAFQETLDNFKDAEWVEDFVRDKNKINRIVLDELKEAGIISKRDFDNISRVRKNYTPLVRIVEEEQASKTMFERLFDLGPEDNTKPFLGMIKRRLSGSIEDTTESYAANITSISKSLNYTEMNRRKVGVLKELLELSDENFSQMFKESKLDVMKAIGKALEGTSPRSVTFGVAKGDAIENFYINGVKIGLTPKAKVIKDFFKYRAKDPMLVLKPFIAHAQLVRNMITVYDPRFQIRSLFGESDTAVMFTKHPKFVDYIPGVKLTKNVNEVLKQTKGTPDDVIQIFKDNYGVGRAVHAADLGGKTIKEQIKTLKSASLGSKTMGTITAPFRGMDNAFHNTAEAVELAPRIAEARAVLAKGGSMSEAITAGKGIGIDFSQRGYTTAWDTLFKSAPFLSSHMKGMDRTFRYMRYEPVTFLKRVLIYGAGKAHMARQWI